MSKHFTHDRAEDFENNYKTIESKVSGFNVTMQNKETNFLSFSNVPTKEN